MECKNCGYYYKDENDRHECCHFTELRGEPSWLDVPPCEEDDYSYENDDWDEPELEEWELAGYWSEEEYIEDQRTMMYVDAWKNGDFEEDEDEV